MLNTLQTSFKETTRSDTEGAMLSDWTDQHTADFQKKIMTFRHKLSETGLFTDAALITLLEKHPMDMLDVCTMGAADHPVYPNKFRTGDFRDASGETLLKAAQAGRVWINVRNAMNIHPEYKVVLESMYGGLAQKTGNRAFNPKGSLLISSPVARVPYHFDKTEVILWHVRGRKRVHIYPCTQKFIPDAAHETILLADTEDDLPFSDDFNSDAVIVDMEENMGATWPLNSPHRVSNESFCVSVTTEYSTRESGMKNAAMITNATLRRRLGRTPSYTNDSHMVRRLKSVAGRIIKRSPLMPKLEKKDFVTFRIDPNVEGYVVDVDPFIRCF